MTMPAGLFEAASALPFDATVDRLTAAIEAAGLTVFATIDHAAAARHVGLSMPPTLVLIYGNARGGTPVMLAAPHVALDLPLRVLVRENAGGATIVAFHPVAEMLTAAGVPAELVHRLDGAQHLLLEAIKA